MSKSEFQPDHAGHPEDSHCQCANCEWSGPLSDLDPIDDAGQRIGIGEETPAGQCPNCGSLAHIAEEPASFASSTPLGLMAAVRHLYNACGEEGSEEAEALEGLPSALNEAIADVIRFAIGAPDKVKIGITIEGGMIGSVFSDRAVPDVEIVVFDYDTDGRDDCDMTEVRQGRGDNTALAVVEHHNVEETRFDWASDMWDAPTGNEEN